MMRGAEGSKATGAKTPPSPMHRARTADEPAAVGEKQAPVAAAGGAGDNGGGRGPRAHTAPTTTAAGAGGLPAGPNGAAGTPGSSPTALAPSPTATLRSKLRLSGKKKKKGKWDSLPSNVRREYVLGKTIGEGYEGRVRVATHKATKQKVAIKFYKPEGMNDVDAHPAGCLSCHYAHTNEPIPHELNIIRLLNHESAHNEHVVHLNEIIHDGEEWYQVVEYCAKGNLACLATRGGGGGGGGGGHGSGAAGSDDPLSEMYAQKLFRELMDGVQYMHARKVCHRDLKLDNLIVNNVGVLKVADFGFAEVFVDEHGEHRLCEGVLGTDCYMAPEVRSGQPYDGPKVDVWSCGVILLVLLTGTFFWNHANPSDPGYAALLDGRLLSSWSFGEPLRALLRGMLDPDPATRLALDAVLAHPWFKTRSVHGPHRLVGEPTPVAECCAATGADGANKGGGKDKEKKHKKKDKKKHGTIGPAAGGRAGGEQHKEEKKEKPHHTFFHLPGRGGGHHRGGRHNNEGGSCGDRDGSGDHGSGDDHHRDRHHHDRDDHHHHHADNSLASKWKLFRSRVTRNAAVQKTHRASNASALSHPSRRASTLARVSM